MIQSDLFEPYEKLIEIEVEGRSLRVPENNRLLRCFQFVALRAISYGDFCWNGDCANCQVWYREPDQAAGEPDKTALACRFRVREGLVVTRLNPCIRLEADAESSTPEGSAAHVASDASREESHADAAHQTP
jgi:hypothetical protein